MRDAMEDAGIDLEHFVGQALIKIRDGVDQARNDVVEVAPMRLAGGGVAQSVPNMPKAPLHGLSLT